MSRDWGSVLVLLLRLIHSDLYMMVSMLLMVIVLLLRILLLVLQLLQQLRLRLSVHLLLLVLLLGLVMEGRLLLRHQKGVKSVEIVGGVVLHIIIGII